MREWVIQFQHDITGMDRKPRKGRNQYDGYVRGCGLQFGNLMELCRQDPDFRRAMHLTHQRTVVSSLCLMNLFMLVKFYLPKIEPGHIIEFGSYKGGSAILMAYLAKRYLGNAKVYALDTYTGVPHADRQVDAHKRGDFNDANVESLRHFAADAGLDNLICVKGPFEETTEETLKTAGPLALVHIDCDIYSAVAYTYEASKKNLVKGGYVVLDDPLAASCLGAFEAMEELIIRRDGLHAEQVMPHPVFRYPKLDE